MSQHQPIRPVENLNREVEGGDLVDADLTCGHAYRVHAASSTFDFPNDLVTCPVCHLLVHLTPEAIAACDDEIPEFPEFSDDPAVATFADRVLADADFLAEKPAILAAVDRLLADVRWAGARVGDVAIETGLLAEIGSYVLARLVDVAGPAHGPEEIIETAATYLGLDLHETYSPAEEI